VEFFRATTNRIIYVQRQKPKDLFTTRHDMEAFVCRRLWSIQMPDKLRLVDRTRT
jgi:hypothetical protein